ncbi:MAG: dienelactone hydrolase family protein [Gemmatimonadota bacterium]|nr:dienelactone hydrolase family protein [Gemmatimonadota bacterium]
MQEHHITVPRTARYVTLGDPSGPVSQIWFACHGYGQLASKLAADLTAIDDGTRLIVVPEALSRFYLDQASGRHGATSKVGASWMTREDRLAEIEDQISYLDALYAHIMSGHARDSVEVIVLGFSQGVATASRWLARGDVRADRIVLWGSMLPVELLSHDARGAWRNTPLTFVCGTRDQFVTEAVLADYRQQLESHHVPFEILTFDGGHRLDDATLRRLADSTTRLSAATSSQHAPPTQSETAT